MSALKYWLWLSCVKGIGSGKTARLLEAYGSPEEIYHGDGESLEKVEGITRGDIKALADKSFKQCDDILHRCERLNITILTLQDSAYPDRLRQTTSPPCVLYVRGRMPVIDEEVTLAVVGTRKPSAYGQISTQRLSSRLAQAGAVIVSGMASGIDAAAHMSALHMNRPTIAVLGCGADICYPHGNRRLYEDLLAYGALLSEYPPGTPPYAEHFPRRNRILSGISLGVVVVEAGVKSGALITAEHALNQGRDVFAVPGNIDSPASMGTNALIAAGAIPAANAWDVLSEYAERFPDRINTKLARAPLQFTPKEARDITPGQIKGAVRQQARPGPLPQEAHNDLTETQLRIIETLNDGPLSADNIIERSGIQSRVVLTNLTLLEMCGIIQFNNNQTYRLTTN